MHGSTLVIYLFEVRYLYTAYHVIGRSKVVFESMPYNCMHTPGVKHA